MTRNPKPKTRNQKPETRNPKSETLGGRFGKAVARAVRRRARGGDAGAKTHRRRGGCEQNLELHTLTFLRPAS